jgi:hypothetical protein
MEVLLRDTPAAAAAGGGACGDDVDTMLLPGVGV